MSNLRTLHGRDADLRVPSKSIREAVSPIARILLPIQGTDREFAAQETAIQLAASLGAPVYAVHVKPPERAKDPAPFRHIARKAREWSVPLETRIVEGTDVVEEILAEAKATDLIVIGTRRLGGRYHVGSVAEQLIRRAPCPVQVWRLPGSDAPAT